MTILDQILKSKREETERRKRLISCHDLMAAPLASRTCISMRKALENSPLGIIAEFKRKSPSKGYIHKNADVREVIRGYARNGASGCSVLTDTEYFGGSLLDLALARKTVEIPLLRKDFIVDAYQITEAKAYGADAILLIAAALSVVQVEEYTEIAHTYGLEVLLEIHQETELDRIGKNVDMVGVNNRNLDTFVTDIYTSFELGSKIPSGHLKVSESAIRSVHTIRALRKAGYSGFLIGEHFMQEAQPAVALKNFIGDAD